MENIFIIPIRSGSKGLPNKNMLNNSGKPLVMHTVDELRTEFPNDNIFISTDSQEYKIILEKLDVNVIMRDNSISGDGSPTSAVILDFISKIPQEDFNLILCQATSPKRTGQNVKSAIALLDKNTGSVVSVTKSEKSRKLLSEIDENDFISDLFGIDKGYTRQNENEYYYPNGAIFVITKKKYLQEKSFFLKNTKPYIMSEDVSVDIDGIKDYLEFISGLNKLEYIMNNSSKLLITNRRFNHNNINFDKLIIDEYKVEHIEFAQSLLKKYKYVINNTDIDLESNLSMNQIAQKYNLDDNNSLDLEEETLSCTIDGYHYTSEFNTQIEKIILGDKNE